MRQAGCGRNNHHSTSHQFCSCMLRLLLSQLIAHACIGRAGCGRQDPALRWPGGGPVQSEHRPTCRQRIKKHQKQIANTIDWEKGLGQRPLANHLVCEDRRRGEGVLHVLRVEPRRNRRDASHDLLSLLRRQPLAELVQETVRMPASAQSLELCSEQRAGERQLRCRCTSRKSGEPQAQWQNAPADIDGTGWAKSRSWCGHGISCAKHEQLMLASVLIEQTLRSRRQWPRAPAWSRQPEGWR